MYSNKGADIPNFGINPLLCLVYPGTEGHSFSQTLPARGSSSDSLEFRAFPDPRENYDENGSPPPHHDSNVTYSQEFVTEVSARPSENPDSGNLELSALCASIRIQSPHPLEQDELASSLQVDGSKDLIEKNGSEVEKSGPLPGRLSVPEQPLSRTPSNDEISSGSGDDSAASPVSSWSEKSTPPSSRSVSPARSPCPIAGPDIDLVAIDFVDGIPQIPSNMALFILQQYSNRHIFHDFTFRDTPRKDPDTKRDPRNRTTCIDKDRDPLHICPRCNKVYHEARDLMAHFYYCTELPLFACMGCKELFARDDNWQKHFVSAKHRKKSSGEPTEAVAGRKRKRTKEGVQSRKAAREQGPPSEGPQPTGMGAPDRSFRTNSPVPL
ncbi:hypothetical protein TWF718_005077 [Orbilia javanica]|uniref:C2H2-type domain-containing protein n=1 Tax=Orbilia javanica TaxID=47235 RepID=A0AAN8MYG4_9PEZI